jgi:ABC-type branched-subunit amino acid transport system ATPase component
MNDSILEMRSITKRFPGVTALKDVSLSVREGEIHAICGENGAGKSTLMKVLSGVEPAGTYEGEIHFRGRPMSFHSIKDSEAEGIVIIHQELALVPHLTIAENIFLGNERSRGGVISWGETNSEALRLLRRVGLDENPVTPVGHLGVGKQQLVEIAKALSKNVSLLILDEPTAALNDDDSEHLLGTHPRPARRAGSHLDHHLPQARGDRRDRRHHHRHPRRLDHRDHRHARRGRGRPGAGRRRADAVRLRFRVGRRRTRADRRSRAGRWRTRAGRRSPRRPDGTRADPPDHQGDGRARHGQHVPRTQRRDRRGGAAHRGLARHPPDPSPTALSWTASRSPRAPARSSASRASWARAAPSSR